MILTDSNVANFWRKVKKAGEHDCWEWTAYKNDRGYGVMDFGSRRLGLRRTYKAHRVSYFIHNGDFDENLNVCHHCDNPGCVNPNHLFLGTQKDNVRDMLSKNRQNPIKGSKNVWAKLTEADAIEARQLYEKGNYSQRQLACKYGVSHKTIWLLIHRKKWTHV